MNRHVVRLAILAVILLAGGAAVVRARWRLDQRRVVAPATAGIAFLPAEPGETLAAGAPVVSRPPRPANAPGALVAARARGAIFVDFFTVFWFKATMRILSATLRLIRPAH